jgi:hypothetical protein
VGAFDFGKALGNSQVYVLFYLVDSVWLFMPSTGPGSISVWAWSSLSNLVFVFTASSAQTASNCGVVSAGNNASTAWCSVWSDLSIQQMDAASALWTHFSRY